MLRSCGRAIAQNFAECAQNLDMCTPKLGKSRSFTIFTCFYTFYETFQIFFVPFLAQTCQKYSFDRERKSTFRRSCGVYCSRPAASKNILLTGNWYNLQNVIEYIQFNNFLAECIQALFTLSRRYLNILDFFLSHFYYFLSLSFPTFPFNPFSSLLGISRLW